MSFKNNDIIFPRCRISIIVVSFKNTQFTLDCFKAIEAINLPFAYEIICVDNGLNDNLQTFIAKDFPNVRFFQMGYNSGFSKANNLGIMNSQSEYILLLNNDTRIIESIFEKFLNFMDTHPKVGALGPRHLDNDGRFQISYGRFPTILTEMNLKIMRNRILGNGSVVKRHLKKFCSTEREVDWLSGSCLFLRRDALLQTGLLDEALFMYFEDVDICKRISNKGWGIYYFPSISIIHYHGESVKKNILTCLFEFRRSQLIFAKKYYGVLGEMFMRGFLLFKFVIIGCFSILEYCFLKLFKKNFQIAYKRMLLSRKVIGMVLFSKVAQPVEPNLKV